MDPSGFFGFKSFLKVVGFALNFVPGFQGWGNVFLRGFINGFLMSGGDLRAGLMGGLGAPLFASAGVFASQIISGTIQGVLTAAMGGKFKDGFLSSLANGLLRGATARFGGTPGSGNFGDLIKRAIRDAVIGGVSAELGGGKFKNGAYGAAFANLFSEVSLRARSASAFEYEPQIDGDEISAEDREAIIDQGIANYKEQGGTGTVFNRSGTYMIGDEHGNYDSANSLKDAEDLIALKEYRTGRRWYHVAARAISEFNVMEVFAAAAYPGVVPGIEQSMQMEYILWHELGHIAKKFGGNGCYGAGHYADERCANNFAETNYLRGSVKHNP